MFATSGHPGQFDAISRVPDQQPWYYVDKDASLKRLFTFGLCIARSYLREQNPEEPPAVGRIVRERLIRAQTRGSRTIRTPRSRTCRPTTRSGVPAWFPASLTRQFAPSSSRRVTRSASRQFTSHGALIRRRDIIARTWLNGVNPIVDVSLDPSGALNFTNAAVAARVATHGRTRLRGRDSTMIQARANGSRSRTDGAARRRTARSGRRRGLHRSDDLERQHPDHPGWVRPFESISDAKARNGGPSG